MIQRILYTTDLGLYSPYMMQYAMDLASSCHGTVDVLHVVEPMGLFAESILDTYLDESDLKNLRREGIESVMDQIQGHVEDGIRNDFSSIGLVGAVLDKVHVKQGQPVTTILEQAEASKADLIVMGAHSEHAAGSGMMGSVTSRVLAQAKVPVFVVPMVNLGAVNLPPREPRLPGI